MGAKLIPLQMFEAGSFESFAFFLQKLARTTDRRIFSRRYDLLLRVRLLVSGVRIRRDHSGSGFRPVMITDVVNAAAARDNMPATSDRIKSAATESAP